MTRGRPAGSRDVETTPVGLFTAKYTSFGCVQRFAVDANFLLLRIDARAKLGDDLPIDLDAAFENQLFAFAPAGNAGVREKLLQPLAPVVRWILLARWSVPFCRRAKRRGRRVGGFEGLRC